MSKYLWSFYWDCGRNGELEGLFVATEEEVGGLIGKEVYFGEVLGKHSEVCGTIEEGEITKVDLDSETVEKVEEVLGETWSGFNPLEYIQYNCEKCDCEYNKDEFSLEKGICVYCDAEQ